jgi:hypothetical protein
MYDQIIKNLREAHNGSAHEREKSDKTSWKIEERQRFLSLLQKEEKKTSLENGRVLS